MTKANANAAANAQEQQAAQQQILRDLLQGVCDPA